MRCLWVGLAKEHSGTEHQHQFGSWQEDSRQKADYQEEEISYTRSGQPREKVSVLSNDGV